MDDSIEIADSSGKSNADIQKNSIMDEAESQLIAIGQESKADSNNSKRISEITNLSAEEEDALLKVDGDTEGNDDEFNEDLLLAGSTDDEAETKMESACQSNVPTIEPAICQSFDEFNQIASNSRSDAVDSIYNDLFNDFEKNNTCNPISEDTVGDESDLKAYTSHDLEFSSLHASSSSDSIGSPTNIERIDRRIATDNSHPSVEPSNEIVVISSGEPSNFVRLFDSNVGISAHTSHSVLNHDTSECIVMPSHLDESHLWAEPNQSEPSNKKSDKIEITSGKSLHHKCCLLCKHLSLFPQSYPMRQYLNPVLLNVLVMEPKLIWMKSLIHLI